MTPEQKIITIAEWEGWMNHAAEPFQDWRGPDGLGCNTSTGLPPYLTSRDAICGAVARLGENKFDDFAILLQKVTGSVPLGPNTLRKMLLATPVQLADALLLTLGHKI